MLKAFFGGRESSGVPPGAAPPTPTTDRGVAILSQAVGESRRYANGMPGASAQQAIQWFQDGAELVIEGIRVEVQDEARKVELRALINDCLTRAEGLKQAQQQRRAAARAGEQAAPAASRGHGRGAAAAPAPSQLPPQIGAAHGERPSVRWDEVAGLENAKAALQEAAVLPIRFPSLFQGERKPWRGILLYGPPGTGKSRLAQAVATEVDASYYSVTSSDLVSKWVGESEKQVRALFEQAAAARPAIIFIDEVDALVSARTEGENDTSRRLKNELLVRMSEAPQGVLVLAATNVPWGLDPAVRRRFERRIYIPLPDKEARHELMRIHLGATPHELSDREMARLAHATAGFSGADLSVLVRDALMEPVRMLQAASHFRQEADGTWAMCMPHERGAARMSLMQLRTPNVTFAHMERALGAARPTVGADDLARHEAFTRDFGAGN